jgi:cell division protein YceG involved in septum cleavage|tara:strand:- start:829 stop:1116 length:288 start_codon:yes stop_codon:yes gene_type:complete
MSNKFLKFVVIFLAVLIVICFALLLYGFYSKISNNQKISNNDVLNFSLNLKSSENIKDIKIIDQNNVLIVISDNDQLYLIMYNLKNNKIVSKIGR